MNELRLQYYKNTGTRISDRIDYTSDEIFDYIEWLEKQIEDATKAINEINSDPIFFNKGKFTTKSDRNT